VIEHGGRANGFKFRSVRVGPHPHNRRALLRTVGEGNGALTLGGIAIMPRGPQSAGAASETQIFTRFTPVLKPRAGVGWCCCASEYGRELPGRGKTYPPEGGHDHE
jgi:hypothetical protein